MYAILTHNSHKHMLYTFVSSYKGLLIECRENSTEMRCHPLSCYHCLYACGLTIPRLVAEPKGEANNHDA